MTEHLFPYEKLQVWQRAKEFTKQVYRLTQVFPVAERYGLTSQVNRAAVSVMSNLAEGSARTSRKDQAHFSQLAYSSLMEVSCQLQLAHELGLVDGDSNITLRTVIHEPTNKINALRKTQLGAAQER